MAKHRRLEPEIVIVGGDGRAIDLRVPASVRSFSSSRYSNGSIRQAVATIGAGSVDLVVLLVRWLGHPEFHSIIAACATATVPILVITGSQSAVRREVREFLASRGWTA